MPTNQEIERRYLVNRNAPLPTYDAIKVIKQGYIELPDQSSSLRIRIVNDSEGFLTCKGGGTGLVRSEFEERLSIATARELYSKCHHRLEKLRRIIGPWEIDDYYGSLHGIRVAEQELQDEKQEVIIPPWLQDVREVTDSLTNLHLARLASQLQGTPVSAAEALDDSMADISRIVVTGGPCSGKSSALAEIKRKMPLIHCVPEVATIVISQVGVTPAGGPLSLRNFQNIVYKVQRIFEETSAQAAKAAGKLAIVIDRGTVDNAAYLPGGITELEQIFSTTQAQEYARYDSVIYLSTPVRKVYERHMRNNPARSENYAQAAFLGERILSAWHQHPWLQVIKNAPGGWKEKMRSISQAIQRVI